jgi:hypothetical protein
VRPGRVAVDGVPVFARAHPELNKPVLHSGELDVVEVTGCGVVFVAIRVWGKSAGGNRLSTRKRSVVLLGVVTDRPRTYYGHEGGINRHRRAG